MARGRGRGRVGGSPHGSGRGRGGGAPTVNVHVHAPNTPNAPSAAPKGRGRGKGGKGTASVASFLKPHTGAQAGAAANAEAGLEHNSEIREGREQAKGSRKREGDLGQWYAQLASDYQGATDQGAAALKSVEDTTSSQLAAANAASSADQASLAAGDEQFANLVGGPKDTAGLAKIAQAAQAAAGARADQKAPLLSEQANFVGRLGADKTAARMQGIEARQAEKARRDKILKDVGAARKEKGMARVANKDKIREADRGYASELKKLKLARQEARTAKQAAAADQAIAQIEASRKASEDAINNRQDAEKIAISAKNAATGAKAQRATAAHYKKTGKTGAITPSEKLSRKEHAGDAMSAAKALLGIKVPKGAQEWAKFEAALIEKLGSSYSSEAARAVAKIRAAAKAKAQARSSEMHRGVIAGH